MPAKAPSYPRPPKDQDRMVFHPGSGDSKKNYAPDLWRRIIRGCMETDRLSRLKPTLLLGPAEASLGAFFKGCEDLPKQMEILCCPEREALLQILGSAGLYLGHDSGVTHLSGLMGIPTVALFKASDPVQWAPLGPRVHLIHGQKGDREMLHFIKNTIRGMVFVDG
jgi:heptosyltransferase-3